MGVRRSRSARDAGSIMSGNVLDAPDNGDDYELLWKQNLTDAVRDLVGAVTDLRAFMAGTLENRKAVEDRLTRLENAGIGIRGWIVAAIAALSFLATASCGVLQLAWNVYRSLGH